jgi:hypothetical protein
MKHPQALRTGGLALGIAIAALLVLALRVPAESGPLGAGMRLTSVAPGEVEVSPTGTLLNARRLLPGRAPARATVDLRNVTGTALRVRLRGLPSNGDLDHLTRIEVLAPGGRPLVRGTLARFRDWTAALRLPRAGSAELSVRAWIPASVRTGYEGRDVDVTVEMRAVPAR